MPYQIRKSDGTVLLTLADGQVDTSYSSIALVGKNVSNFGEIQNNDFLHLVENFAKNSPPPNQLRGQIWYDIQNYAIKFYDGANWQANAVLDYASTQPTSSHKGYMWYDTTRQQLFINVSSTITDYQLVGPENVVGYGTTKLVSATLKGTDGNTYPVMKMVINGEVLGVISASSFINDSSNSLTGFVQIARGTTYKNYYNLSSDVQALGNSYLATTATTSINVQGGRTGSIPYQTAAGQTSFIGIGSNRTLLYSNGTTATWQSIDTMPAIAYATSATNIAQGYSGSIVYQTRPGETSFIPNENLGYMLVTGVTRPTWATYQSISNIGHSLLSSTATDAAFLRSADSTSFIPAATAATISTIAQRDDQGDIYANVFQGIASSAAYADLAENYLPDTVYEVGTVMVIGGDAEVTASTWGQRAIGVISDKPAYLMNKDLTGGIPVALKGRVPVKVIGSVRKGDRLIASNQGCAVAGVPHSSDVFAIALESNQEVGVKLVEAVIL